MADKDVLSQEEIDALLSGVDQGDVDTSVDDQAPPQVRSYDLTRQDAKVRGRLPTLELLGEKFARELRVDLHALLRFPIEVGAGGVQILSYGEYVTSLYVPTSITLVKFEPLSGLGLVVIDAKLVSRIVDQFFGGDGRHISMEGRDFTATEKRVIQRILELVYRDLADAWAEALPVALETVGSETNPALINHFAEDEVMMVNTYHIELESGGGEVHVSLPYASLEPYRELLDTTVRAEETSVDETWQPSLESRLLACEVPLRCAIAARDIKLRELLSLTAGDVIGVDMPDEHLVFANGTPAFYARLGEAKGNLALEFLGREPGSHN